MTGIVMTGAVVVLSILLLILGSKIISTGMNARRYSVPNRLFRIDIGSLVFGGGIVGLLFLLLSNL